MSQLDFDTQAFKQVLQDTALEPWADALGQAVVDQGHGLKHGHLPGWENAVASLPPMTDARLTIEDGKVCIKGAFSEAALPDIMLKPPLDQVLNPAINPALDQTLDPATYSPLDSPLDTTSESISASSLDSASDQPVVALQKSLNALKPWRKGPFEIGPLFIDTEWRSDWKWDRIEAHITDLQDATVLDVGCGSGYHLWRMRKAGAKQVLGIDPSLLYLMQFKAIQHYAQDEAVQFLPLPMEALPASMKLFDTIFSMGVLYHRREPSQHLDELKQALSMGGELVLETLVIPDQTDTSLIIDDRYANMRNIYELPSITRLENWISAAGFQNVRTVSIEQTSCKEQRTTRWMPSHSLAQSLDPENSTLTIEGYPRPLRAVVIATQ